jgi:hypothetical protein
MIDHKLFIFAKPFRMEAMTSELKMHWESVAAIHPGLFEELEIR